MRARRMMPRVLLVVAAFSASARAQEADWKKSIDAGTAAYEAKRYDEAERQFKAAVAIAEKAWPEGPRLAKSLYELAGTDYRRRNYREAEALLKRSLAIREKAGEADSSDAADTLGWLAASLLAQRKLAEAEPFAKRAMALLEKTRGADAPDMVNALKILIHVQLGLNKFDEVEPAYQATAPAARKEAGPRA